MGAKIQGREVSGTPVKFAGYTGRQGRRPSLPGTGFEVSGKASAEAGKNEKSLIGAGLFR